MTEDSGKPRVLTVILNYNGWERTRDCLDSLSGCTYPNAQILLIDNASNDDLTPEFRDRYPNIVVVRNHANLGFAKGANMGIRAALDRGADYVWLLNNDTTVGTDTLSALVQCAERAATAGAVGSVLLEVGKPPRVQAWGGGSVNLWTGLVRHKKKPVPFEEIDYINGASMLLRCNALRTVGLLDERYFMYWEDVDMCWRLRAAGWGLAVAPEAIVHHVVSASSASRWRRQQYLASAALFLRRNAPLPALAVTGCTLVQKILAVGDTLRNTWRRGTRG